MLQLDIFKPDLESKIEAMCASYAANLKSEITLRCSAEFNEYFDNIVKLETIKMKKFLSEHPNLVILT